jgi:hypothetical protein
MPRNLLGGSSLFAARADVLGNVGARSLTDRRVAGVAAASVDTSRMAYWSPEKKADWPEHQVALAFGRWLEDEGWTEIKFDENDIDVVAKRGNERLVAEAKGRKKKGPGQSVDALYGQLLRRMPAEDDLATRFALVVDSDAAGSARRVKKRIRDLLRIEVYSVSDTGDVERLDG